MFHYTWPLPAVFPWRDVTTPLDFAQQSPHVWTSDLTTGFRQWSRTAETELLDEFAKQVPVSSSWKGRGQTCEVSRAPQSLNLIKPGRSGDVVPRSSFLNRMVHQWFKQLRRLQAYLRRASSGSIAPALLADQCLTWRAIIPADGFSPSFVQWWQHRDIRFCGLPDAFPMLPPSRELATALFQDFEANYRAFERWHIRQRTKVIKAKHFQHNRLLYQQLRPQKAAVVSHLQKTHSATVAVLHADHVQLDRDLPPLPDATWTLQGVDLQVTRLSADDCVRLHLTEDCPLLQVGQTLTATIFQTAFPDLEQQFHDLWQPIWQRHAGLAESHWDRIIAFGKAFLPVTPGPKKQWTSDRLSHSLHAYKRKATRGPDAWSRDDLIGLSSVRQDDLARMFTLLETGTDWPRQLVTGFVCPIAKCENPTLPSQYRPIVLISLLYRLWAATSFRDFLPHLCAQVPSHVFGYIPGRRASDIWTVLQLALELAFCTSQSFAGYCSDIVKCFNRLPRAPLIGLLRHMGLAPGVITAWTNALHSLERRIRIQRDTGPPRTSVTGFPEGDPLSCLAMLCFNCVLDAYVKHYAPQCVPFSYVDNVQLVSADPAQLQPGILVFQTFMDACDLSLDHAKSYTWATTSGMRATLKAFGHVVRLACKDLGAQMHYSQKTCRQVLKSRIDSVSHFRPLLRHSTAAPWFRRLAIRVAAWPKVFHSCEVAWISDAQLDGLRSRCMYALRWDRAGASPILRWALMQPLGFDPSYVQVWQVFSSFFRLVPLFPFVREAWIATATWVTGRNGILHAMQCALDMLGWTLDESWRLVGPWFELHWYDLTLDTLEVLVGHSWQQTICQRLTSRKDLAGLHTLDVHISFGSFKPSDLGTAELVSTVQDGTFCTNSTFAKYDPEKDASCTLCGVEDTLEHRCMHCPRFAHIRAVHPEATAMWYSQPRAFREHALVELNPFLEQHWNNLLHWNTGVECFRYLAPERRLYHLFTDGSCQFPTSKVKRLAAWAVVELLDNRIISSGLLGGVVQSNDLAELTAAHSALRWAHRCSVAICIHSDSTFVVDGLTILKQLGYVPRHWRHQGTWADILETISQLDTAQWDVHHVFSHGDEVDASSELQEWWIRGNNFADATAGRVFQQLPTEFSHTYASLCAYHDVNSDLVNKQLAFLVAVAQFELHHRTPLQHDEEDVLLSTLQLPWFPNESRIFSQCPLEVLERTPVQLLQGFSAQFCRNLVQFLCDLDISASRARAVTGVELLLAFVHCSDGMIPFPRLVQGEMIYEDHHQSNTAGLMRHTMASALRVLKLALDRCSKIIDISFFDDPSNRVDLGLFKKLKHWSIFVGWPVDVENVVAPLVRTTFGHRPYRLASDLARPIP